MSTQNALLPHKHVRFCDSILGLAGYLRSRLAGSETPTTIDELWAQLDQDNPGWPGRPPFYHVVLAVDVLFAIGQLEATTEGRVYLTGPVHRAALVGDTQDQVYPTVKVKS